MAVIDPTELARALIRRPSVTPADEGAIDVVAEALTSLGFSCTRLDFGGGERPTIANLYARRGDGGPVFCFAGHTDVVPAGDDAAWTVPPFEGRVEHGRLWGRGAADMKGSIAAFIAAVARIIEQGEPAGAISLLITGDEEGPAIDGTRKVLDWLAGRGERIDHCLVGEPSSLEATGDTIKVGRRGSLNGWITVHGRQGHVAYPDRAANPVHALAQMVTALTATRLDGGYERFQQSSLQFTDIDVGNPAHNIIPARARARFNVRFNPTWTGAELEAWLREKTGALAAGLGVRADLEVIVSGEAFLTTDDAFLDLIADAIEAKTGARPDFSTTGGTSDARFIKDVAPVAELGLVGATIHQVDEHVAVADIEMLTDIYAEIIARYFRAGLAA